MKRFFFPSFSHVFSMLLFNLIVIVSSGMDVLGEIPLCHRLRK